MSHERKFQKGSVAGEEVQGPAQCIRSLASKSSSSFAPKQVCACGRPLVLLGLAPRVAPHEIPTAVPLPAGALVTSFHLQQPCRACAHPGPERPWTQQGQVQGWTLEPGADCRPLGTSWALTQAWLWDPTWSALRGSLVRPAAWLPRGRGWGEQGH